MNAQPLVSVLTPVYNDGGFLEECITSVLAQSYANWEHMIVDNASTDNTSDIAAKFAGMDSRISHKRFEEFVPVNENHNRAFRCMSPDSAFCKVVEADDWIFPECLSRMVEVAASSQAVGVVSAYRLVGDRVDLDGLPYQQTVVKGSDVLRQTLMEQLSVIGSPTSLMFRADLVRATNPFFDVDYFHGDTEAAYRVLSQSDFGFVHQVLTYARRQGGTQISFGHRMNTFEPEGLCFLLRYGPATLEPREYRGALRLRLRRYVSWHAKQAVRPSRLRSPQFFAFHEAAAERILEVGGADTEVRAAVMVVKSLLARRRLARPSS